jgi:hypothetical protein
MQFVNEGKATEPAIKNHSRKAAHYRTFTLPLSKSRKIPEETANKFCSQVSYSLKRQKPPSNRLKKQRGRL